MSEMDDWEKELSCAAECPRCEKTLGKKDRRVLSVYDHQPICVDCKQKEETRADYSAVSKQMMARCIEEKGKPFGDAGGYCFHHFCPYTCK